MFFQSTYQNIRNESYLTKSLHQGVTSLKVINRKLSSVLVQTYHVVKYAFLAPYFEGVRIKNVFRFHFSLGVHW